MASPPLNRILRDTGIPNLADVLSAGLAPTDLQSLLIEVSKERASKESPSRVLDQYATNRFVKPSAVSPLTYMEFDQIAFAAAKGFEPIELAPVCPLATSSALSTVSQNNVVATIRNTEVVSDSTNVMALECALRRRKDSHAPVRLCSSHRLVRAQSFSGPAAFAHFKVFALCTAGRDEGAFGFEFTALRQQIEVYLRLFAALNHDGFEIGRLRLVLTDFTGTHVKELQEHVADLIGHRDLEIEFAPERESGKGYYDGVCFQIHAKDATGTEHFLVDGGFTTWTQKLLSNKKERLLISGVGSERVCSVFRRGPNPETAPGT
jgi:hypothetical protein